MKALILSTVMYVMISTSCNPKYYTPNTQNVPLISEKSETNLTLSGNGNQVEFQAAYGVSKSFAISGNGGLFIPANLSNGNGGSGKFMELGAGYFAKVGDNLVFETYAIAGFGSMENHLPSTVASNPTTKGDVSARVFRYGLQPNFGYKTTHFSAAVSSRIVNLSYSEIAGDLIFDGAKQIDYIKNNQSNFLIEPALTIRGGLDKIKLQLQYIYSVNLSNTDFLQDKSNLTVGLNFNFK